MVNIEEYKKKYIGLKNVNNVGESMEVVDYISGKNTFVKFEDGTIVKCNMGNFKNGAVKNPNTPSVFGIGIVGNKYPITENRKPVKEYATWHGMLERCYHARDTVRYASYKNCTVVEEWFYYNNFYEWIQKQLNYEKWKNGNFSLDKDILHKGNKIYSPDNCTLVPSYINNLFTKHDAKRGPYPIGVSKNKTGGYIVRIEREKYVKGGFKTVEDAFYHYKEKKENIIKNCAEKEYANGNITKECYEAMIKYEVEITD